MLALNSSTVLPLLYQRHPWYLSSLVYLDVRDFPLGLALQVL